MLGGEEVERGGGIVRVGVNGGHRWSGGCIFEGNPEIDLFLPSLLKQRLDLTISPSIAVQTNPTVVVNLPC